MDESPSKRYICFDLDECIGRFILLMPLFDTYGNAIVPTITHNFNKNWIFRPGFDKIVRIVARLYLRNKIGGAVLYSNNDSESTVKAVCEILNNISYTFNRSQPFIASFHRSHSGRVGTCKNFIDLCRCMKIESIEPPTTFNDILYFDDTLSHHLTVETKHFKHTPPYVHDIDVDTIKAMFSDSILINFETVCKTIQYIIDNYDTSIKPPNYEREAIIINEMIVAIHTFIGDEIPIPIVYDGPITLLPSPLTGKSLARLEKFIESSGIPEPKSEKLT